MFPKTVFSTFFRFWFGLRRIEQKYISRYIMLIFALHLIPHTLVEFKRGKFIFARPLSGPGGGGRVVLSQKFVHILNLHYQKLHIGYSTL